jgi:hypothetical protein
MGISDIELMERVKEAKKTWRTLTPEEWTEIQNSYRAKDPYAINPSYGCYPDCPICEGRGYAQAPLIPGEEKYARRVMECPNLYQVTVRKMAKKYGMIAAEIDGLEWSIVKDIGRAWYAMEQIKSMINDGHGWIFLWGDHGQAKTLLLKIAAAHCLRNRKEAAYTNMVGILDNLKRAFSSGSEGDRDAESKIDWWQNLPVLAIDEFNRVKESEWSSERRFALMDMRYVQAVRHETITLIASNTSPEQQDSYLRDRILDGRFQVIELKGPSARKSIHDRDFTF